MARISDETWRRALQCANAQYELHVAQGKTATADGRLIALNDALQHAVGLIRLRSRDATAECGCDGVDQSQPKQA